MHNEKPDLKLYNMVYLVCNMVQFGVKSQKSIFCIMRLLKSIFEWHIRNPEMILYKVVGRTQKSIFGYKKNLLKIIFCKYPKKHQMVVQI